MAVISLTIPDAQLNRILDAFATKYSWDGIVPPTKAAFAKQKLIQFVKNCVVEQEQVVAANTAIAGIVADVNSINII